MKKMKKNYCYIFCIFFILVFSGCEKFLVHDDPTNVYDEIWWKTETNATNALNSVYSGVPDGTSGRQFIFLSALSDELVARQSIRGDYESYVKGLQSSSWSVAATVWNDDYRDIRRACRFLENVDKCFFANQELKTRYKYEARALRAYYHMELLLFFGGVPIVTSSLTPAESYLFRNTEEEVYGFILSELIECAANLPDKYIPSADYGRISSAACWALVSRMALFYHKYDIARDASKKIIDMKVYSLYKSLNVNASYADLFLYTGKINDERIFYKVNGASDAWTTMAPQGQGGKTVISPTAAVVNNYETKQGKTIWELGNDSAAIYKANPNYNGNRDPRMAASVLLPGQTYISSVLKPFDSSIQNNLDLIGLQNSTSTGFWMNKYLDPKDKTASHTLDFMIIRYAEVLLNYAESLVELDDITNPDIAIYLNDIRRRAGMPDIDLLKYNSQAALREFIRRERQSELAFEGVRYFDIRRWEIANDVMNGQVYGAVNPSTSQPVNVEVRSFSPDRDFWWPVPQIEILANPNMTQNPGYN